MRLATAMAVIAALVLLSSSKSDSTERFQCGDYQVIGSIPGKSDLWDYASIEARTHRLYLSSDGVLAVDLKTRKLRQLISGGMTHGVLPVGHGLIAVADATRHAVLIVQSDTGLIVKRVVTGEPPTPTEWQNPDALALASGAGLLIAVNHDSGSLVLIDLRRFQVVGRVKIGGKLEFAAANGTGTVFVNIETQSAIGVVDLRKRRLLRRITLRGCESPTGLAYDPDDRLVMTVCSNGVVKFIDSTGYTELASVKVGRGADAILYDGVHRRAFTTNGDDGTLTVIDMSNPHYIHVVQTLPTQSGARLGALDVDTGRLYIPAVRYDLSAPPLRLPGLAPLPAAIADTFRILIVGPHLCRPKA